MSKEVWVGCGISVWMVVGFCIWLGYCWDEGYSDPHGDGFLSPSFVAQLWPLVLVLMLLMGVLFVTVGPFWWAAKKLSNEAARRGRERKESGVANSGPGR